MRLESILPVRPGVQLGRARGARPASTAAGQRIPTTDELRAELRRVRQSGQDRRRALGIVGALVVVAAVGVLVATMLFPVLRIFGSSMEPTLSAGDLVVCHRGCPCATGDLVAFYYNNKVLVKRVIATGGQQISIDERGDVYVNGTHLDEPYVSEKALGDCNLSFPFEVPEGRLFVMGDHRASSTDSRNSAIGCVGEDELVGRLVATVWPPGRMGLLG